MTLSHCGVSPKASELYDQLKNEKQEILRDESVRGFRSFVKIINSFEQIEFSGSGVKRYTIKKEFMLGK
jgi:cell fate (sporulation/competence/biofilm development) regulator YlbF (YheA/YmcA/DUF963 family)